MDIEMDIDLAGFLISLSICVILPIAIVYLTNSRKMRQDSIRKDIILAALEKNANIDIEELVRKTNAPKKLLKEKLLRKLLIGSITLPIGLVFLGVGFFAKYGGDPLSFYIPGTIVLVIGIAYLVNYFVGRRMLAKEMENEEQNLCNS
ncbi:MAG: hypothetical protein KBT27_14875 [Prevotellaceae bacterium]|nr:hypothetical protein [Candidatus Faecinaster equi]